MDSLNIGMAAWIIQDGNYNDFSVGQEAQFALEFYSHSLTLTIAKSKSAKHLKTNLYQICGQVVYKTETVWVLDIGILVYQESMPPKGVKVGSWVEAEIYIGIDPFFYFEYLNKLPGMPELRYKFRVEQIFLKTTPWITSRDESGRTVMSRDEKQESYREVAETDAWNDDTGNANYILKCICLNNSG